MSEWVPVLAGIGFIGAVLILMVMFRRQEWVQELSAWRGVTPSHTDGILRPRDFLRAAGIAGATSIALLVLSLISHWIARHYRNATDGDLIASAYSFSLFLASGIALLYGLVLAVAGVWLAWKLRNPANDPPAA